MTVEDFCNWIESSGFKDGDRLPSVREVAVSMKSSTFTIFRAYKKLLEQGKIYAEQGNGYFWGRKSEIELTARENETERLERLLVEDWKSGKISADSPLPSIKNLCVAFNASIGSMRRTLEKLRERGILERKGRGRYYFGDNRCESFAKEKVVLLIMRCTPEGDFNGLGDRELEFMKKVYVETLRRNLRLRLLGYCEDDEVFLDGRGNRVEMDECRDCFGAIVSTMLVFSINKLFVKLSGTRFPVAIWWEHPLYDIPRAMKKEKRFAFFNLAFGEFPGRSVGKFLKEKGIKRIAFISPYHMSTWSRDRLNGLKKAGLEVYAATDASHASPFDFMQEPQGHERLQQMLLSLVKDVPAVGAWVVVNDKVGVELMNFARQGKIGPLPYMVSFDNTTDSYRNRLDSYEFNLEALAEQSVYHLVSPGMTLDKRDDFRELFGHVVEK